MELQLYEYFSASVLTITSVKTELARFTGDDNN